MIKVKKGQQQQEFFAKKAMINVQTKKNPE